MKLTVCQFGCSAQEFLNWYLLNEIISLKKIENRELQNFPLLKKTMDTENKNCVIPITISLSVCIQHFGIYA